MIKCRRLLALGFLFALLVGHSLSRSAVGGALFAQIGGLSVATLVTLFMVPVFVLDLVTQTTARGVRIAIGTETDDGRLLPE